MRKPHLACDMDLTKAKYPGMYFPKIDGVRLMHITGSATGRSLKPHANLYTTERFSKPIYEGLDGEATCGPITGQSLCRDTTSALLRIDGTPDIIWNVFDWLHPDVVELPYLERYEALQSYLIKVQPRGVWLIPYELVCCEEDVMRLYNSYIDQGFEGGIYRSMEGRHKDGRATTKENAYLRMKPSSDKEARVVRLVEALENQNEAKVNELGHTERSSHQENKVGKGMVGVLVCADLVTGKEFNVSAGKMTHSERIHAWEHPEEWVGSFIKYRSLDTGVKDEPRFARYISRRMATDMS